MPTPRLHERHNCVATTFPCIIQIRVRNTLNTYAVLHDSVRSERTWFKSTLRIQLLGVREQGPEKCMDLRENLEKRTARIVISNL